MAYQAEDQGRMLPDVFRNKPDLWASNILYWQAFWQLRKGLDRTTQATWHDTYTWCIANGLSYFEMLDVQSVMIALEHVFISHQVEVIKREREAEEDRNKNAANKRRVR